MAKKQEIKDPLNMDEAISASEAFFLKNKNIILGVIGGIILLILAVMGYKHSFQNLASYMPMKLFSRQKNCSVLKTSNKHSTVIALAQKVSCMLQKNTATQRLVSWPMLMQESV